MENFENLFEKFGNEVEWDEQSNIAGQLEDNKNIHSSLPNGKNDCFVDSSGEAGPFAAYEWEWNEHSIKQRRGSEPWNQINFNLFDWMSEWGPQRNSWNQLSSRLLDWWVMGAAAPMAPPKRADGGRKRVGLNECSWKQRKGVNEALAGQWNQ